MLSSQMSRLLAQKGIMFSLPPHSFWMKGPHHEGAGLFCVRVVILYSRTNGDAKTTSAGGVLPKWGQGGPGEEVGGVKYI